jgi:purine-binding chemotaxis protein CheW
MTLQASDSLVIFAVDEQQFALPLAAVWKIVRAAEIAPLPGAPPAVLGVVNIQGKVIPIYDVRLRLGRPARPVRATDHFVIAHTSRRTVGLLVDVAVDVVQPDAALRVSAEEILPGLGGIESVLKAGGQLILIHDLERFLSEAEEQALAAALQG